jgi:hypothetical protein
MTQPDLSYLPADDQRPAREIVTHICGIANKRRAYLCIDGQLWAVVRWAGKGCWRIEDNEHLYLDHVENAPRLRGTLKQAIALALKMIRNGGIRSPAEARRLAHERRAEQQRRRLDAWSHRERLHEALGAALLLWNKDPGIAQLDSLRRVHDELIALAEGAIDHFERERDYAQNELTKIELGRHDYYGSPAEWRALVAYADERLARAREILRGHASVVPG